MRRTRKSTPSLPKLLLVVGTTFLVDRVRTALSRITAWEVVDGSTDAPDACVEAVDPQRVHDWVGLLPIPADEFASRHHFFGELRYGDPPPAPIDTASPTEYLFDPWSDAELHFRLTCLERNRSARLGQLSLKFDRTAAWTAHRRVALSAEEYLLLRSLVIAPGSVVKRSVLQAELGGQMGVGSRALDMRVARLRAKLRRLTGQSGPILEAVAGEGYRFVGVGADHRP